MLLYPSSESHNKLHQPPTKGEIAILKFLESQLDNSYEVYFQAYVNGDRPDIIIMKKGCGVLIIEVKDWEPDYYYLDSNTNWFLKNHNIQVKSPFKQVLQYKKNLFELHSMQLMTEEVLNYKTFSTVNCCVFFLNFSNYDYNRLCIDNFKNKQSYINFLNYFTVLTSDVNEEKFKKKVIDRFFNRNNLFSEKMYNSLKRLFYPPFHYLEEGKNIIYTREQKKLLNSRVIRQKIKGTAGSGKTYVLAKRAVNSYVRTRSDILILTYNITLKNYIRDRINDVRENFPWNKFIINHYHSFFKIMANNYGLKINKIEDFQNINFFNPVAKNIRKFNSVFIDEVQDYREEWLFIINKFFINENTEYVVFGDEKQNIFDRELDEDKTPKTFGIRGQWNTSLKTSLRFNGNIARIAALFQQEFFSRKYNIETYNEIINREFDFDGVQAFYNLQRIASSKKISELIDAILKQHKIHPSDVCILASEVSFNRELDYHIRKTHQKTWCMFESKEIYSKFESLYNNNKINYNVFKTKIDKLRRGKKIHFYMKTGLIKLSTIHSFKGWDISTLVLIINDGENTNISNSLELIYTAITRAKNNLFIINNSSTNAFNDFFKSLGIFQNINIVR